MNSHTAPAFPGQTVRVSDEFGVCGGGVVTDVGFTFIEVAQRFTHRHNGRVVESGTRPMKYSLAAHTFEVTA
jgi:hypothetical protein